MKHITRFVVAIIVTILTLPLGICATILALIFGGGKWDWLQAFREND